MQTAGVGSGVPHGVLAQVAAVADSTAQGAASVHGGTINPAELKVENPVPGFIGQMLQVGFNLPSWVQISLVIVGAIAGLAIAFLLWKNRNDILAWFGTRSRGYKMGVLALAGFMVVGGAGAAYAGNNYMNHNNDFCMSCHVMGDAWTAFAKSEHRKLGCHDCHRQSMYANVRQLYFWVAERPSEIPKHAGVPTAICSECHVQSRADSGWKRIIRTAGHRLHMESDSSALKDVKCVTCHGQEVHRFKPVDKTCGMEGCHDSKDTKIVLGSMAGQTSQHCTSCHTFTRVVPENISMDSTKAYLKPTGGPKSCFGCHQMKDRMKGFNIEDDKGHGGVCGTCHNPHTQQQPKSAYETCASSGCHADLAQKSKFHAKDGKHGSNECGQCHQAHGWKPIGTQCIDCHKGILDNQGNPVKANQPKRSAADAAAPAPATPSPGAAPTPAHGSLRPIAHTTTTVRATTGRMLRRTGIGRRAREATGATVRARHARFQTSGQASAAGNGQGGASASPTTQPPAKSLGKPKDSGAFSHRTHKVLACGGCHTAASGTVFVKTKSDCAQCHHSTERPTACEGCHVRKELDKAYPKTLSMRTSTDTPLRSRQTTFNHLKHRDLECKGCHTQGVLLTNAKECTSCHVAHHEPERACLTCHVPAQKLHQRASHDGCAGSGCHSNAAVLALPPSRETCLVCHNDQVNHKPKRECAECHAVSWTPTARAPR